MVSNPMAPSPEEADLARESSRKLASLAAGSKSTVSMQISTDGSGKKAETIVLPRGALQLLLQLLTEMSKGNAVTLMPVHAHLTTQEAADILGVSRPFVIKEIKEKKIPHQLVGTHRRILFKDLISYKERCLESHNQSMDALVQQAQELKLGY